MADNNIKSHKKTVFHSLSFSLSISRKHIFGKTTGRELKLPPTPIPSLFRVKTLNLCLLPGCRSFHSYSQLSFPSLVGPPPRELHHSLLHVGPPHCEKCGSVTVAFRYNRILSTVVVDIPVDCGFQSYQNPVNSGS